MIVSIHEGFSAALTRPPKWEPQRMPGVFQIEAAAKDAAWREIEASAFEARSGRRHPLGQFEIMIYVTRSGTKPAIIHCGTGTHTGSFGTFFQESY